MKKTKKINIAFVIHTLGRGGAEIVLVNLVNRINKDIFDVTVYPIIETGNLLSQIDNDVKIKPILPVPKFMLNRNTNDNGTLLKGDNNLSFMAKLYLFFWNYFLFIPKFIANRKLKNEELIVSYLEGPSNKLVSSLNTKAKRISWIHVDLDEERKSERFYRNQKENIEQYDVYDAIVAVSNDVKVSVNEYLGVKHHVDVLHNIYDTVKIKELASSKLTDDELKYFEDEKLNLVSVGRLSTQKGYDRLIEAMNELRQKNKEKFDKINIIILGTGEEATNLENLIDKYALNTSIKLIGFNNNPYKFIKRADAFISSSRTEGFSTVVVESVLLGKTVLTTDCSGMREILDGYPSYLVKENTVEGIYELLETVNKELISNLDGEIIFDKFNEVQGVRKHEEYFLETLKA